MTTQDATSQGRKPFLPPRVVIRVAWVAHRALYRGTGGRRGLWPPRETKWGTMLLTSTGRKTGKVREAILAYYEDGPNLVTLAMNGWGAAEPAWWLNLQKRPEGTVRLRGQERAVRAHAAEGEERARLWALWLTQGDDVEGYSVRRPGETAVVVLEPRVWKEA